MVSKVILNDRPFKVKNYYEETVVKQANKANKAKLMKVGFDFKVTSAEYHDVTTLLYKNDFYVEIPEKDIQFWATISQYSTSLTNLNKENQVSDYRLELIEKNEP